MFQTAYLDGKEILLIAVYGDEAWTVSVEWYR